MRESTRLTRRKKIVRLAVFALVCLIVLLYGSLIGGYVYFWTRSARGPVCCAVPADWGAASYQEVAIPSTNGVTLAGWYVPPLPSADAPASTSVIILLHGYGENRLGMRAHAEYLNARGYGVLMVDLRGHGESTGDRVNGWQDPADVGALVDFLAQQPEVGHIGALGFSVGGQVTARAAVDLPQIEALVIDGPFPATARDVRELIDAHTSFAFWYVTYSLIDGVMALACDVRVPESAVEALARMDERPVLIIAGAAEHAEPDYGRAFRAAVGDNGDLWLVEGATHGTTWLVAPDYGARVIAFFDAAFAE